MLLKSEGKKSCSRHLLHKTDCSFVFQVSIQSFFVVVVVIVSGKVLILTGLNFSRTTT